MKKLFILTLALGLFSFSAGMLTAQEQPTPSQTSTEELDKQKAEREKAANGKTYGELLKAGVLSDG